MQAGSLAITSQQDTSVFKSKQTNVGLAVSADFGNAGSKGATNAAGDNGNGRSFGGAGASVSFGQTKQSGDFASVQEQSGIFAGGRSGENASASAGSGGFDIKVAGSTTLTGGVIASTAAPENNQLTTGTLSATDLQNREKFKASSINLSASISGIGRPNATTPPAGTGNTAQVPANGQGEPTQSGNRTGTTAGLRTGIGTIAAGAPSVANASGTQSSTTVSAIATGGITITSGDTASLGVAQSISRDTSAANEALTKQFTEAKRNEISEGFAAAQALTQQVSVFFNNRAQDEAAKRKLADDTRATANDPNSVGADGTPLTLAQRGALVIQADLIEASANRLQTTFGGNSAARLIATAFTGAAGANVSGSLGSLIQGTAVNVLQGLATNEVKKIADSLGGDPAAREAARAALQAVVGCAGAAAGGSNGCGSAAAGAAASVVLNNLLNSISNKDRNSDTTLTLEEQAARTNLVGTLIAAIASGAGLDAQVATNAAILETENNDQARSRTRNLTLVFAGAGEPGADPYVLARLPADDPRRASYNNYVAIFGNDPEAISNLVGLLQTLPPGASPDRFIEQALVNQRNDIITTGITALRVAGYGALGFAEGFFVDGAGNLIVDTSTLVGETIQFGADSSTAGIVGDFVRDYFTIPDGIPDELIPSRERGLETQETIRRTTQVIATYARERFNDPDLLRQDVEGFLQRNFARLKDEYAAAKAAGPEAEARFFGRIAGRATFEAATLIIAPVKIVQGVRALRTVGTAAEVATDAGRAARAAEEAATIAADARRAAQEAGDAARAAREAANRPATPDAPNPPRPDADPVNPPNTPDTNGNPNPNNADGGSNGDGRQPEGANNGGNGRPEFIPSRTDPSGTPGGVPEGTRSTNLPNADSTFKRGIELENQSADLLANSGFRVRQLADGELTPAQRAANGINDTANPDFLIEGRVFDAFAPRVDRLESVIAGIRSKVSGGQARRIVVNLADAPNVRVADIQAALQRGDVPGIQEVIVIDPSRRVRRTFPPR